MTANRNIGLAIARYVAIDVIGDIIYFPLWWYSAGLKLIAQGLYEEARRTERSLALRLLAANLFNPMFGQYDRAGRIISFFMRLCIMFGRFLYFVVKLLLLIALFLLWIVFPLVVAARAWQVIRY